MKETELPPQIRATIPYTFLVALPADFSPEKIVCAKQTKGYALSVDFTRFGIMTDRLTQVGTDEAAILSPKFLENCQNPDYLIEYNNLRSTALQMGNSRAGAGLEEIGTHTGQTFTAIQTAGEKYGIKLLYCEGDGALLVAPGLIPALALAKEIKNIMDTNHPDSVNALGLGVRIGGEMISQENPVLYFQHYGLFLVQGKPFEMAHRAESLAESGYFYIELGDKNTPEIEVITDELLTHNIQFEFRLRETKKHPSTWCIVIPFSQTFNYPYASRDENDELPIPPERARDLLTFFDIRNKEDHGFRAHASLGFIVATGIDGDVEKTKIFSSLLHKYFGKSANWIKGSASSSGKNNRGELVSIVTVADESVTLSPQITLIANLWELTRELDEQGISIHTGVTTGILPYVRLADRGLHIVGPDIIKAARITTSSDIPETIRITIDMKTERLLRLAGIPAHEETRITTKEGPLTVYPIPEVLNLESISGQTHTLGEITKNLKPLLSLFTSPDSNKPFHSVEALDFLTFIFGVDTTDETKLLDPDVYSGLLTVVKYLEDKLFSSTSLTMTNDLFMAEITTLLRKNRIGEKRWAEIKKGLTQEQINIAEVAATIPGGRPDQKFRLSVWRQTCLLTFYPEILPENTDRLDKINSAFDAAEEILIRQGVVKVVSPPGETIRLQLSLVGDAVYLGTDWKRRALIHEQTAVSLHHELMNNIFTPEKIHFLRKSLLYHSAINLLLLQQEANGTGANTLKNGHMHIELTQLGAYLSLEINWAEQHNEDVALLWHWLKEAPLFLSVDETQQTHMQAVKKLFALGDYWQATEVAQTLAQNTLETQPHIYQEAIFRHLSARTQLIDWNHLTEDAAEFLSNVISVLGYLYPDVNTLLQIEIDFLLGVITSHLQNTPYLKKIRAVYIDSFI